MSEREVASTGVERRRGDEAGPLLARFARPRCATPTTIAVLADPHLSTRKVGSWKQFHETERRLRTAVADVNRRDVDGVVVAGDLTENGHPADFERVHDLLGDLAPPTFAVPGNHDVPMAADPHETPPVGEFERRFTPDGLPFHTRVGGVDLVGLDTASAPDGSLFDGHEGAVSPPALSWLAETLPETGTPLVVGHHPLAGADDDDLPVGRWRSSVPLRDGDALRETMTAAEAPLYLSAHLHVPTVARAGEVVRELVVPPLCSFPQGYALLRVGPGGTTVRYVPVADGAAARDAYLAALDDKPKSEAVARLAADRFESLPLADETGGRPRARRR